MFKLKKNFSALFCFCAVMFITYRTCADVCFLPSMDCADGVGSTGVGGGDNITPDNCTDTCSAHGWKDSAGACSYGYDIKTDNCRNTCYACKDCTDTCSNHGWTSAYSTCQYGYEKKDKICNTQCYQCSACTPKECSGYDLTTKPTSGGDTYDICDPGCDKPKLYKCASGYKYESGKCTEVKNCTNNGMYDTKEDCDKAIKNENRKKCVVSGKCYTTEKNCGTNEYVDEATCKNANPSYSCKKTSDSVCWEKDKYICDETSEFSSEATCKAKYSGYNCKQNSNNCWIKGDKEDTCDKWLIIYSDISETCIAVSSFEVDGQICADKRCKVCVDQTLKINYTEKEMGQYETCRFDGFSVNGTGKILPDNTFTLNEENINKYIGSNFDYWNEDTEEVFIASEESYSKENTEIVFEWYDDEADDAGEHCETVWNPTHNEWLQEYNATVHFADWSGYLYLESNTIGLDKNTWTLPVDMEIIVTYDKPYVYRYGGGVSSCTWISHIGVAGTETIILKMPKGSKIGTRVTIQAPEYVRYFESGICNGGMCTTMENKKIHQPTITYKINGSTGSSRTIGNIRYSINNI